MIVSYTNGEFSTWKGNHSVLWVACIYTGASFHASLSWAEDLSPFDRVVRGTQGVTCLIE